MASSSRLQYDRRDHRMDELPEGVAIEPIMGCNLRCPMCPVTDAPASMDGRTPTLMPLDLYTRIIEQISDRPRSLLLTILGEPLLHPRILDFVTIAKSAGHHVGLITNATKLTPQVSTALLDAGLDYMAVSIDGWTKEIYESIRIGARHEAVLQNLRDLVAINAERGKPLRLELNYVVSRKTAPEKEAFYREFAPLVHKINFNPIIDWGGQLAQLGELTACDAKNGDSTDAAPLQWHGAQSSARVPCFMLWNTMFISAEGRAMLCCSDFKQASKLSSVKERSLLDIWRTDIQEHRRKQVEGNFDSEPCRSCRINDVPVVLSRADRQRALRAERWARLRRTIVPDAFVSPARRERRRLHTLPFGHLDNPVADAIVSGAIEVQGWALGSLGRTIQRVDARVDGQPCGVADLEFFRPDVGEVFPGDGHSFCGFSCVLDTVRFPNGRHTIEVLASDGAGQTAILGTRSVNVRN